MRKLFSLLACVSLLFISCKKEIQTVDCAFTAVELEWLAYDPTAAPIVFEDENANQYTLNVLSRTYSEREMEMSVPEYTRTIRKWEVIAELNSHAVTIVMEKENSRINNQEVCGVSCFLTFDSLRVEVPEYWVQHADELDTAFVGAQAYPLSAAFDLNSGWFQPIDRVIFSPEYGFLEIKYFDGRFYRLVP